MNPESFLPLQEPTFLILLCLQSGDRHGYALLKEVNEMSAGRVALSTGTLYGALNRLLEQGLIERVDSIDQDESRGKKSYHLSRRGQKVVDAEVTRLQQLLTAAKISRDGRAPA